MIDLSGLLLERPSVVGLVEQLSERGVRILGLAGVETSWAGIDLPPILTNGRSRALSEIRSGQSAVKTETLTSSEQTAFDEIAWALGGGDSATLPPVDPEPEPKSIAPLVVEAPVRSGQSIFFPEGDVIVIGALSSGADVIAGGSVHVYGTARGRIMAGAYGDTRARIFCRRLEAELLAVGGFYMTADDVRDDLRGQAVHAWLEDQTVQIAKLD